VKFTTAYRLTNEHVLRRTAVNLSPPTQNTEEVNASTLMQLTEGIGVESWYARSLERAYNPI